MTPAQLTTLKTAITNDATANAMPNTSDGNFGLAAYLNTVPASPTALWIPNVSKAALLAATNWVAFKAIVVQTQNVYLALASSDTIDATAANVRAGFGAVFAGADLTALQNIAQRPGTRFEVIFAAGGPPAVSTMFGVQVSGQDVMTARNS